MFGGKREKPRNRNGAGRANVSHLGLLDMGSVDMDVDNIPMDDDDEVDESLEAELLALTSGKLPPRPQRRRAPNNIDDLNKMISDSMKEDEPEGDDNEDLENDSTLMAELHELVSDDVAIPADEEKPPPCPPRKPPRAAPPLPPRNSTSMRIPAEDEPSIVAVIRERIAAYSAVLASSRSAGETSKIKRYERALRTLESLEKVAKAGRPVAEDEIPPMVAAGVKKPPPAEMLDASDDMQDVFDVTSPTQDPIPTSLINFDQPPPELEPMNETNDAHRDDSQDVRRLLMKRRDQYKQAALTAKRNNDTQTAISCIKIVKQFEAVIEAHEQGQPIDLSGMPPAPSELLHISNFPTDPVAAPVLTSASQRSASSDVGFPANDEIAAESEDSGQLFNAPATPASTIEALEQRFQKYKSSQQEAQEQGNGSKARRLGRIVKQYDDAIKLHKAGKPVPFDELPDPPGFGPIPRGGQSAPKPAPAPQPVQQHDTAPVQPSANHQLEPVLKNVPQPSSNASSQSATAVNAAAGPSSPPSSTPAPPPRQQQRPTLPKPGAVKRPQALHEKQLAIINERQRLFREAAIEAKRRGDLVAAKEYLRLSKGFDQMIEAAKCGLPVNIDSSPVPPQLKREDSFEVVEYEDCAPPGDRDEAFKKLEHELTEQILMCNRNAKHFSQVGDVTNCQRFVKSGENARKDLTALQFAMKRGDPVPRFHYETRSFSIIRCFTDLTDNDFELTVVRGINYSCSNPKEIDTYVKFEFPFPSEAPVHDRTSTVKDTNNPEYNRSFVLPINRKTRNLARIFKRGHIKMEVIAKGGFFRSDSVLGTVQVKLVTLETKCLIHDTFDLLDGRKPVGGKLEVKIRVREPLLSKQVEEAKEKWLVIDQYVVK